MYHTSVDPYDLMRKLFPLAIEEALGVRAVFEQPGACIRDISVLDVLYRASREKEGIDSTEAILRLRHDFRAVLAILSLCEPQDLPDIVTMARRETFANKRTAEVLSAWIAKTVIKSTLEEARKSQHGSS